MSIKEKHDALFVRMMGLNKTELLFLERSQIGVQPTIYRVDCIPSSRDKAILEGSNLKIAKEIEVRIRALDLAELISIDGTKKFCNIDEIQQKMEKVIVKKQRYSIDDVEINTFETVITLRLSIDE